MAYADLSGAQRRMESAIASCLATAPSYKKRDIHSESKTAIKHSGTCLNLSGLVGNQRRCGQRQYSRQRDLPGLLHLFPDEITRLDKTDPSLVLKRLVKAMRAERRRGRENHWRYSLTRHIGLMQALSAERARLGMDIAGD